MPEKRDQSKQMQIVIALHWTHKHTCARSPFSWPAAVRSPVRAGLSNTRLPPALRSSTSLQRGVRPIPAPKVSSTGSRPFFPCGKPQLVRAALPPAKGNFQQIQDTGVPKFAGAAGMLLQPTQEPGTHASLGIWSPRRPGWAHAPTRSPARGWGFFLRGGRTVKFAAAAPAGTSGMLRAGEPGAGAPLRGDSHRRRPSPRAGGSPSRDRGPGQLARGSPQSRTHLLLDGAQQPLPGLRLCGEKGGEAR